jgi:hypothetical protein
MVSYGGSVRTESVSVRLISYFSLLEPTGFGPAPATFLIPSLLFPPSIRSTANGLAAAVGKMGAILGIFVAAYLGLEISNMMAFFCGIALMGCGTTLRAIQAHFHSPKKTSSKDRWQKSGPGGSSYNTAGQVYNYQSNLSAVREIDGEDDVSFDHSESDSDMLHPTTARTASAYGDTDDGGESSESDFLVSRSVT